MTKQGQESGLMIFVQYIRVLYTASLEVAGEQVILMISSIPGSDGHYYFLGTDGRFCSVPEG